MKKQKPLFNSVSARASNLIGIRISQARHDAGMSLVEFSRLLEKYGVCIKDKGLSKWENGETVPNAYQLIAVCHALCIDNLFTPGVQELNDIGRRKLSEYKADLIASGRYNPVAEATVIEYIDMPVYYLTVSAGSGMFLDGDAYETMSFPRSTVPLGAEFGVKVSGDSMEPAYQDGQIVWVQPCDTLRLGEVGIFVYDGEGYIKAYGEQDPGDVDTFTDSYGRIRKQPMMISFNQKYAPRVVSPDASFQIVGRVLC